MISLRTGVAATALVAGLFAASTAQAVTVTFDLAGDPVPTSYSSGGSFSTNSGSLDFEVQSGGPAVIDSSTSPGMVPGAVLSPNCSTGFCSSSGGTKALYVFGSGSVRMSSLGNVLDVFSFDAAIALVDAFTAILGGDNTYNTQLTVTGYFNAGGTIDATFPLLDTDPNYIFASKALSGFVDLDYIDFAYDAAGLSTSSPSSADFAIDNIEFRTKTAPGGPPTGVPEPGTLGLLAAALAGFGWSRRRKTKA